MYLYVKVLIDEQPIKFASFVTGVSIAKDGSITYTLAPTTVFTESDEISLLSVESDKNNINVNVWFHNKTEDFYFGSRAVEVWTDSGIVGKLAEI
jgi:hypothetical protein